MPAEAKKRVRAQLKPQPGEGKTIWERLEDDDVVDPPVDVTGAIYPKRPKVSKRVAWDDLPKLHIRVLMQYLREAQVNGVYDHTGYGTHGLEDN